MTRYAQTNLQLYRQLQAELYSRDDILLVDSSYRRAMRIFAGHYRPNNKPFLTHLVGVASILASLHEPAAVVAAGLLHSAYSLGLGHTGSRFKPHYRKELADELGIHVEKLIHSYSNRSWSVNDLKVSAVDIRSWETEEKQLYVIKLADIHEEFLDDGHRYQPNKKLLWDEDKYDMWLEDVAGLIGKLGFPEWAEDFQNAVNTNNDIFPAVISSQHSSSFVLSPGWSESRLKSKLINWLIDH